MCLLKDSAGCSITRTSLSGWRGFSISCLVQYTLWCSWHSAERYNFVAAHKRLVMLTYTAKEHATQRVSLRDTAWDLMLSHAMLVDACSAGWTSLSWPCDNGAADGAVAAMTCYEADELVGSSRMQAGPVHLQCCFQAWKLQLLLLYYSWASWICTCLLLPGRRQVSH